MNLSNLKLVIGGLVATGIGTFLLVTNKDTTIGAALLVGGVTELGVKLVL